MPWHELGYKSRQKGCLGEFLERGKAGGGLGTPVLRTSVEPSTPGAALLLFFSCFGRILRPTPIFPWPFRFRSLPPMRENHANARKISPLTLLSAMHRPRNWRLRGEGEKIGLTGWASRSWHESGYIQSTTERLFGVKMIWAAVHSRGEVGIEA
jgi:hypothetical protein